jgi:hypothetical protein
MEAGEGCHNQIAMSENVSIREIAWRRYNVGRPASFFIRIVGILDLYELPPFTEVMNEHFKKIEWKGILIFTKCSFLISLYNGQLVITWVMVSVSSLHIGQVGSTSDWLNSLFSVCSMYVPVRLETETITHVITSCPLYNEIRKEHFVKIKETYNCYWLW